MCLRIVDRKWAVTFFNAGLYRVDILVADSPTALGDHPFGEGWPYHVQQYRVEGLGEGIRSRA